MYRQLEEDADENISGEFSGKHSLKNGLDCIGGADHKRIYVRWPQEACFIGPDRTAGLTTIAAEEPNPVIQKNMFLYLSAILRYPM